MSTCLLWYRYQYITKSKVQEATQSGKTYLNEILTGHSRKCPDIFKMSSGCFLLLANELKHRGLLRDSYSDGGGGIGDIFIHRWPQPEKPCNAKLISTFRGDNQQIL